MVDASIKLVRDKIPASAGRRSTILGLGLCLLAVAVYTIGFSILLTTSYLVLKIFASGLIALSVCIFFVLGHDACHGSLTPRKPLNKLLGRICFLPNFHPYAAWEWTHNGKHHSWTNVKGKDIVYAPFSPSEYAELPRWRRVSERFFRTAVGLGPLYFFTVYLPYEIFPSASRRPPGKRGGLYQLDRALVLAYLILQVCFLVWIGWPKVDSVMVNILLGFIVPQIAFHFTMGFVTYIHHTHPRIPWYRSEEEYTFFRSQVASTSHIEFPWLIEVVLHNILKHTAHHIDPRIPLYRLTGAQAAVEMDYAAVVHEPFTLAGFIATLRCCKLYDYDAHRWVAFDGTPMSETHKLSSAT